MDNVPETTALVTSTSREVRYEFSDSDSNHDGNGDDNDAAARAHRVTSTNSNHHTLYSVEETTERYYVKPTGDVADVMDAADGETHTRTTTFTPLATADHAFVPYYVDMDMLSAGPDGNSCNEHDDGNAGLFTTRSAYSSPQQHPSKQAQHHHHQQQQQYQYQELPRHSHSAVRQTPNRPASSPSSRLAGSSSPVHAATTVGASSGIATTSAADDDMALASLQTALEKIMRTVLVQLRRVMLSQSSPTRAEVDLSLRDDGDGGGADTGSESAAHMDVAASRNVDSITTMLADLESAEAELARRSTEFVHRACLIALRCLNAKQPTAALRHLMRADTMTQEGAGKTFKYVPDASEQQAVQETSERHDGSSNQGGGPAAATATIAGTFATVTTHSALTELSSPVSAHMHGEATSAPGDASPAAAAAEDGLFTTTGPSPSSSTPWEVKLPFYAPALDTERLRARATLLNNRGLYHFQMGECDLAKQFLTDAATLEEALHVPTIGITYFNLAQTSWEQANQRQSRCVSDSNGQSRRTNTSTGANTTTTNLTNSHQSAGRGGRASEAVVAAYRSEALHQIAKAAAATEQEVHRYQTRIESLEHAYALLQEEMALVGPSPEQGNRSGGGECDDFVARGTDVPQAAARAEHRHVLMQEAETTRRSVTQAWARRREAMCLLAQILAQNARWLREGRRQLHGAVHLYEQSIRWLSAVPNRAAGEQQRLERLRQVLVQCKREAREEKLGQKLYGIGATASSSKSPPPSSPSLSEGHGHTQRRTPPSTNGTGSSLTTPNSAQARQGVTMLRSMANKRRAQQQAIQNPHHHIVTTLLPPRMEVSDPVLVTYTPSQTSSPSTQSTPVMMPRVNSMAARHSRPGTSSSPASRRSASRASDRGGGGGGSAARPPTRTSPTPLVARFHQSSPYLPTQRPPGHAPRRRAGPRPRHADATAVPEAGPRGVSDVDWHGSAGSGSSAGTGVPLAYPYYYNPPSYQHQPHHHHQQKPQQRPPPSPSSRSTEAQPRRPHSATATLPAREDSHHQALHRPAPHTPAQEAAPAPTPAEPSPATQYYYYWCDGCQTWHYHETVSPSAAPCRPASRTEPTPEAAATESSEMSAMATGHEVTKTPTITPSPLAQASSPSSIPCHKRSGAASSASSSSSSLKALVQKPSEATTLPPEPTTPPESKVDATTATGDSATGTDADEAIAPPPGPRTVAETGTQTESPPSTTTKPTPHTSSVLSSAHTVRTGSTSTSLEKTTSTTITSSSTVVTPSGSTPPSRPRNAPALTAPALTLALDEGLLAELIRRLVGDEVTRRTGQPTIPTSSSTTTQDTPTTLRPLSSQLQEDRTESLSDETPPYLREPMPPPPLESEWSTGNREGEILVLDAHHAAGAAIAAAAAAAALASQIAEPPSLQVQHTQLPHHNSPVEVPATAATTATTVSTGTSGTLDDKPEISGDTVEWQSRRTSTATAATAPVSFCADDEDDDEGSNGNATGRVKNGGIGAAAATVMNNTQPVRTRTSIRDKDDRPCASTNATPMKRLPDSSPPEPKRDGDAARESAELPQPVLSGFEATPDASAIREDDDDPATELDDDDDDGDHGEAVPRMDFTAEASTAQTEATTLDGVLEEDTTQNVDTETYDEAVNSSTPMGTHDVTAVGAHDAYSLSTKSSTSQSTGPEADPEHEEPELNSEDENADGAEERVDGQLARAEHDAQVQTEKPASVTVVVMKSGIFGSSHKHEDDDAANGTDVPDDVVPYHMRLRPVELTEASTNSYDDEVMRSHNTPLHDHHVGSDSARQEQQHQHQRRFSGASTPPMGSADLVSSGGSTSPPESPYTPPPPTDKSVLHAVEAVPLPELSSDHTPLRSGDKTIESAVGTPYTLSSQATPTQTRAGADSASLSTSAVASPNRESGRMPSPLKFAARPAPSASSNAARTLITDTPPSPLLAQEHTAVMTNTSFGSHVDETAAATIVEDGERSNDVNLDEAVAAATTTDSISTALSEPEARRPPPPQMSEPGEPPAYSELGMTYAIPHPPMDSAPNSPPSRRSHNSSLSSTLITSTHRLVVYGSHRGTRNRAKLRKYLARDRLVASSVAPFVDPNTTTVSATTTTLAKTATTTTVPATVADTVDSDKPTLTAAPRFYPPAPPTRGDDASGGSVSTRPPTPSDGRPSSGSHLAPRDESTSSSHTGGTRSALPQTLAPTHNFLINAESAPWRGSATAALPKYESALDTSLPAFNTTPSPSNPCMPSTPDVAPTDTYLSAAISEQQRLQKRLESRERILRDEAARLIQSAYTDYLMRKTQRKGSVLVGYR